MRDTNLDIAKKLNGGLTNTDNPSYIVNSSAKFVSTSSETNAIHTWNSAGTGTDFQGTITSPKLDTGFVMKKLAKTTSSELVDELDLTAYSNKTFYIALYAYDPNVSAGATFVDKLSDNVVL